MTQTPPLTRRKRNRILFWLYIALGGLLGLTAVLTVLTVLSIRTISVEVTRAEQSLRQLENVRALEAAFSNYLLTEIRRRLTQDPARAESDAAGALRGTLHLYRMTIAEEIALAPSEAERDAERSEMVRAGILASIFESLERTATLERFVELDQGPSASAQAFLARAATEGDTVFKRVVQEILQDERAEAESAFSQVARLRDRALAIGAALALLFVIAAAAVGALFYRGLMRPISTLTQAVEGFAEDPHRRVPDSLPGEFAILGARFNQMAERISTEQGRLQAEVAARTADVTAANASLTRVDKSRRAFFANVSHELRTPVTILLGEAQVALQSPGEEVGALTRIAAHGGFLRRRLDDLMRLARSEDGTLSLSPAPMNLRPALAEAVSAVGALARAQEVTVRLADGPDIALDGDAEALRQAALAMIDNAIKFSPPGGAITVSTSDRGFSVTDQGPGFGDTDLDTLFERYHQSDAGRSRGGAGLGLAIVKWIADQHGARLFGRNGAEGGALIGMEFGP